MSNKILEIEKAFTHAGKFHADDVFSGALLRILNPEIEIILMASYLILALENLIITSPIEESEKAEPLMQPLVCYGINLVRSLLEKNEQLSSIKL